MPAFTSASTCTAPSATNAVSVGSRLRTPERRSNSATVGGLGKVANASSAACALGERVGAEAYPSDSETTVSLSGLSPAGTAAL